MRIWDVSPARLCRKHLLAEHRELHGLWNILTQNKVGYAQHPETLRWRGKLKALYLRHEALVQEFGARGYTHRTPLDAALATGSKTQDALLQSLAEQYAILRAKGCECQTEGER